MFVHSVRPDASELSLRVFNRGLHPELHIVCAKRMLQCGRLRGSVCIGPAGHVVSVRFGKSEPLTEVVGHGQVPLPSRGECLNFKLGGNKETTQLINDTRLHHSSQIEVVDMQIFAELHQELERDSERAWLVHSFGGGHRLMPAGISVIQLEATPRSLLIHAYHTFPENNAILRTQSLFESGEK